MDTVASLIQAGDLAMARLRLASLVEAGPGNADARRLLGRLELALGNAEAGRAHLLAVYGRSPKAEDIAYEVGVACLAAGDLSEAVGFFRQELDRDGSHQGALFNLAWALKRLNDHSGAAASLGRLVELAPGHGDAWFNLGNALTEGGRLEEAAAAYARVIALAPARWDAVLNLAQVCRRLGRLEEARQGFAAVLEQDPESRPAVNGLGGVLVAQGLPEQAEPLLRRRLDQEFESSTAMALAEALKALGRGDEARDMLLTALELDPGNAWGWQLLGLVEISLGDYGAADDALDRGSRLDPQTGLGDLFASPTDLWRLHPRGDFFLGRGGDRIAPPRFVCLALTNKCNLRCDICGSQGSLDATGSLRSSMPIDMFRAVAETLFPMAVTVELNSQGDPLLHPQIVEILETIEHHRCLLRLQTNGTVFDDAIIERLLGMHAVINISVDAVGPLFDQVRRNGRWELAEPKIRRLAKGADPERQLVQIYPTVTARTVAGMMDVFRWADDCGIAQVEFHPYDFNGGAKIDTAADPDEIIRQLAAISHWAASANSSTNLVYQGELIHAGRSRDLRGPSLLKRNHHFYYLGRPVEGGAEGRHPTTLCCAPSDGIFLGIHGEIAACCRSDPNVLGYARAPEDFADVWFGENYRKVRDSLLHGAKGPFPLPACGPCVQSFAPQSAAGREAMRYVGEPLAAAGALTCSFAEIPMLTIQRLDHTQPIFTAYAPDALIPGDYRLFEDGLPLHAGGAVLDEVASLGQGRWTLYHGKICFSSGDGSDPQRNGRAYCLRRIGVVQ